MKRLWNTSYIQRREPAKTLVMVRTPSIISYSKITRREATLRRRNPSNSSVREALIKSHRGRCGKKWPRARRLRGRIPAEGCNREANKAPGRLSPQPEGLKPFVDFCHVARSGETAAGIAQHSRLEKSANALQRPSWDLFSASLAA
jgi:hypothetical protein